MNSVSHAQPPTPPVRSVRPAIAWLIAIGWLLGILVPATGLTRFALGQWRIPLDAVIVAAVLACFRRPAALWTLWMSYCVVLGLFILRCFNIDIRNLAFYSEFAGSIPAPQPELLIAIGVSLLLPLLGVRVQRYAYAQRWRIATLALIATLTGCMLRTIELESLSTQNLPIPTLTMAKSVMGAALQSERARAPVSGDVAQGPLARELAAHGVPDQLYLNTVESWSDSADGLAGLIRHARQQFGDRLGVAESGYRPSYGMTVQGELRELCGIEHSVRKLSEVPYAACLPNRLARRGYDTVAAHGYESLFYMRSILYRRLGFSQTHFLEDLRQTVPSCEGVFPGLCDLDLLQYLLDHKPAKSRQLVYMMSLQSHEPVRQDVLTHYRIEGDPASNSTAVAHAFVMGALDRIARARLGACGALIYFVGDHPPPSSRLSSNTPDQVSYLLLRLMPTSKCAE